MKVFNLTRKPPPDPVYEAVYCTRESVADVIDWGRGHIRYRPGGDFSSDFTVADPSKDQPNVSPANFGDYIVRTYERQENWRYLAKYEVHDEDSFEETFKELPSQDEAVPSKDADSR